MKKTMYEKIWDSHLVVEAEGQAPLIYVDRHLMHEVTSPQAFEGLRLAGRKVRNPHSISGDYGPLCADQKSRFADC